VRFGVDGPDCSLCIILKEESEALGLLAGVTDDSVPGLGLDFMRLDRSGQRQQPQGQSKHSQSKRSRSKRGQSERN
jgi:hypothetical protein